MIKYFKDEETKKIKLSEYLKLAKSIHKSEYYVADHELRVPRIQYIMDVLGDVELDEATYKLFLQQFRCCGGRYDVRTKKETIKGMYDISKKYPFLTTASLDEIWFVYIHDQFEEYKLVDELGKYFERYGKTKEALKKYLYYVDEIAEEYDKQFHIDAAKLGEYCEEYGEDLIKHLQFIIKKQHISLEKMISSLPSKELIIKDKKQLGEIMKGTRIFFGACYPISYQMIESLATSGELDRYPEQPQYLICGTTTVDATFTKKEFLDSIKERVDAQEKQKVLKIKH